MDEEELSPEVETPEQPAARRGRPPKREDNTEPSNTNSNGYSERVSELEIGLANLIAYAKKASGSSHLIPDESDPVWRAEKLLAEATGQAGGSR